MKTIVATLAAALISQAAQAVLLPFTDHFAYADGQLFTVASGVWSAGGSAGPELTVTTAAALSAPPGFAAPAGKGARWQPSGTARRNLGQFNAVSSGDLYASFQLNIGTENAGPAQGPFAP
jgi:hypothetical protein